MAPWSITAVRNGDVQEPSHVPYKTRAPEQILNEAWSRHADSKSTVHTKARKPSNYVGLSRFQFGDGEYQASVAAFRKYHAKTPEEEALPEMPELVQATRTMARTTLRAEHLSTGQYRHQPSMASIRRRHSAGDHLLTAGASSAGDADAESETEAEVEAFTGSESDECDCFDQPSVAAAVGRGREYGRAPPLGAGLLVSTVDTAAAAAALSQRRQSNPNSLSGQGFDAAQRLNALAGRFSAVEGLSYDSCGAGSGGGGGGGGGGCGGADDDDGVDGDEDDFGSDPGCRPGLLTSRESVPGRTTSHVRQLADAVSGSGRRSNGGGGGGVTSVSSLNRPAVRRASPPPAPPPPSDSAGSPPPLQQTYSQPETLMSVATPLDRVHQMLHDLRVAKRPEPPTAILPSAPGTLAGSANARPQRTQRGSTCGEAGAVAAAAAGAGRGRRCSALTPGEVNAEGVPRLIVSTSPKRVSRAGAPPPPPPPPPRLQPIAAAVVAGSTAGSSPSSATVSPVRQIPGAAALPLRQSGGASPWQQLDGALRESTEDEVVLIGTPRGAPSGMAAAAAAAADPSSSRTHSSVWPSFSATAAEAAAAAAAAAAAGMPSLAAPNRSKSQTAVGQQPAPPPARGSAGAPLGGWTGRPLPRQQNLRQSIPNGGGSAAAAAAVAPLHSVHFAADAVGPVSFRAGSDTGIECSSCDDGARPNSWIVGARFVWAAGSSGGGGSGSGTAATATAAVTLTAAAGTSSSDGAGGPLTPRPPDQPGASGAGRAVGRLFGGLFHHSGVRRDSSGGLRPQQ